MIIRRTLVIELCCQRIEGGSIVGLKPESNANCCGCFFRSDIFSSCDNASAFLSFIDYLLWNHLNWFGICAELGWVIYSPPAVLTYLADVNRRKGPTEGVS